MDIVLKIGFGFFLGLLFAGTLSISTAQTIDLIDTYKDVSVESYISPDLKEIVIPYETVCKGYQHVTKMPDGTIVSLGYGALADDFTYEIPATISVSSSTKPITR